MVTSDGYLTSGVGYAHHPHRDTWYSAPMAQLNWWLPIYEIESASSMAFHPRYWDEAVKNGSADFNYYEWNSTGRKDAAKQVKSDTRKQPKPEEELELEPEVRLVVPAGGIVLFSAAQLHSTVPNTSGRARYSIDFRTVNLDDVAARRRRAEPRLGAQGHVAARLHARAPTSSACPEEIAADLRRARRRRRSGQPRLQARERHRLTPPARLEESHGGAREPLIVPLHLPKRQMRRLVIITVLLPLGALVIFATDPTRTNGIYGVLAIVALAVVWAMIALARWKARDRPNQLVVTGDGDQLADVPAELGPRRPHVDRADARPRGTASGPVDRGARSGRHRVGRVAIAAARRRACSTRPRSGSRR